MPENACPDPEQLEQMLLGKLPETEREAIGEHLQQCEPCTVAADTVVAQDDLTAAIRARRIPSGDEDVLSEAIERGKKLGQKLETQVPEGTAIAGVQANPSATVTGLKVDAAAEQFDFLAPAEQPDEIGRLGDYRILQVLGIGGMGVVFLAEDDKLKRQVALKVMKPSVAASQSSKERFLREAQFTAAIEHDNIVSIYQVGEDNGVPFIAMPFLKGESLKARLDREGRLPETDVLKIGHQVAAGLAAAHERNLIHRDIKPDNIWLEEKTNRAKILDFGLVRAVSDDAGLTQSGTILGTPRYMAPEQALGEDVDKRCDLFSLGAMLYHLASGRPPFEGSNVTATLMAVVQQQPKPLDSLVDGLHPILVQVIGKLLTKDRKKRPNSAAEVSKAFAVIYQKVNQSLGSRSRSREHSDLPPMTPHLASQPKASESLTTLAPDIVPLPASLGEKPPSRPPMQRILAAAGASGLVLALLALIIVKITNKEGNGTTLRFPKGTEIDIDVQPGSKVSIREEPDAPNAKSVSGNRGTSGDRAMVEGSLTSASAGWPADAPPPAVAPFSAEQARQHQEAWAKYLNIDVDYTNSIGMKFMLIPPGEFTMGSTPEQIEEALKFVAGVKHWENCVKSEGPQHTVILTQPIYLSVNEVTQAEYEKVMGVNPSSFAPMAMGEGKDAVAGLDTTSHPVETVSWNDAAEFCAKLSSREELKPFYFRAGETITPLDGTGYRLPTEAEWECACRAGTTTKFWIGDQYKDLVPAGWFDTNSGRRTHAAGELKANPYGLFDIHGNVWEWVEDRWVPTYYEKYQGKPAINPSGPSLSGAQRVTRGGSWHQGPSGSCAAIRIATDPTARSSSIGFRVAIPFETVQTVTSHSTVPGDQPAQSASDTQVIDFVRSTGGRMTLGEPPLAGTSLTAWENPPSLSSDVVHFDFRRSQLNRDKEFSDEQLAVFAQLIVSRPDIKVGVVSLVGTNITNTGLRYLKGLPVAQVHSSNTAIDCDLIADEVSDFAFGTWDMAPELTEVGLLGYLKNVTQGVLLKLRSEQLSPLVVGGLSQSKVRYLAIQGSKTSELPKIEVLTGLTNLSALTLDFVDDIPPAYLRELHQNMPMLDILHKDQVFPADIGVIRSKLKEGMMLVHGRNLPIAADVPASYRLEFNARRTKGDDGIAVLFRIAENAGVVMFSGWGKSNGMTGLALIDGVDVPNSRDMIAGDLFADGKVHHIVLTVSPMTVTATVDEKTLIQWKGDPGQLSPYGYLQGVASPLFLVTYSDFFVSDLKFEAIDAVEVSESEN